MIMSSSKAGVFTLEMVNHALGISNRMGIQDVRMEDLLIQARFENKASLTLFNGLAKVNLDLLLYQINKKSVTFPPQTMWSLLTSSSRFYV